MRLSRIPFLVHKLFQLCHEGFHVLELPVYGGEADIGHGVQRAQVIHDDLPDLCAGNLPVLRAEDIRLNGIDHFLDLLHGNGTLIAGAQDAVLNLGAVVLFPRLILFDDRQRDGLHLFICGETLAAGVAETSSADGIGIFHGSGIYDPRVILVTKRTFHRTLPFLYGKRCAVLPLVWEYYTVFFRGVSINGHA